jgi:hypothetical protein
MDFTRVSFSYLVVMNAGRRMPASLIVKISPLGRLASRVFAAHFSGNNDYLPKIPIKVPIYQSTVFLWPPCLLVYRKIPGAFSFDSAHVLNYDFKQFLAPSHFNRFVMKGGAR